MVVDRACACATSAPTQRAEVALGRAADRRPRAQRRRQDEPARGAVLRLHRALVPDDERARGGALRRRRRARVEVDGRDRDGEHELSVGFAAGRGQALQGRRRAGRAAARRAARARWSASSCPTASSSSRAPPALRRAHLDQVVAALWPARAATRRAVRAGAGPAQRAARARARRRGRARALAAWDLELARHGIALRDDRAARASTSCAARFAERRRASSGSPAPRSCATARARRPTTRRGARRRARRAPRRRPRARLHRPRPAPRRRSRCCATGASCAPTARRASSGWRCWRCCSPSARSLARRARRAAAAAARRRHERARRRPPRAARRAPAAAGQALVTTTDLAHVPGADEADVVRLRGRGRRRDAGAGARGMRRREPRARRRTPIARARRPARAADDAGRGPARLARAPWATVVAAQAEPTGERDGVARR